MPVFVGTSGWQYPSWRRRFYPGGLAQGRWLEHYAERFQVVEVNNTFYRLPERQTFERWAARTPADFVVVCKASRFLTHVERLKEAAEPVRRFRDRLEGLGAKRGPVLLQLPPDLRRDTGRLREVLERFAGERVAVEFRHESWFTEDTAGLLAGHDAALCLADRRSRVVGPVWATASWGYVRLHEGRAHPRPCYGSGALTHWAERLAGLWGPDADTYVFFNNDPRACAVRDAVRFAAAARRAGLSPTRVPGVSEVAVSPHRPVA